MELSDVSYHEIIANNIAVAVLSLIDTDGHNCNRLNEIADHKSDGNTVSISYIFIKSRNEKMYARRPCKDGNCRWSVRMDHHPGFY